MPELEGLIREPIAICAVGAVLGLLVMWLITKLGWLRTPSDTDARE